jgi:hypothetical protein
LATGDGIPARINTGRTRIEPPPARVFINPAIIPTKKRNMKRIINILQFLICISFTLCIDCQFFPVFEEMEVDIDYGILTIDSLWRT